MNLACPKCRKFYRTKKGGIAWEEGMPATSDLKGQWQPYKLWIGDLKECPGCGGQVIMGPPAGRPIAEHYMPTYADQVERLAPIVRIDDCDGPFHRQHEDFITVDPAHMATVHDPLGATWQLPVEVNGLPVLITVRVSKDVSAALVPLAMRIVKAVPSGWPLRLPSPHDFTEPA